MLHRNLEPRIAEITVNTPRGNWRHGLSKRVTGNVYGVS